MHITTSDLRISGDHRLFCKPIERRWLHFECIQLLNYFHRKSHDQAIDPKTGLPFKVAHYHQYTPAPVRGVACRQLRDQVFERGTKILGIVPFDIVHRKALAHDRLIVRRMPCLLDPGALKVVELLDEELERALRCFPLR